MGLRLSLLVLRAALVGGVLSAACGGARPPAARTPDRLPGVVVMSLDRNATSLPVLTRGKPALVALWATWCEACDAELAELDRLHQRVEGRAVVVGVAVGEPSQTVRDFLSPRGLRYAQLIDEQFLLADALGSERVPSTLVVDREGVVRFAGGALDAAALEALRQAIEN